MMVFLGAIWVIIEMTSDISLEVKNGISEFRVEDKNNRVRLILNEADTRA